MARSEELTGKALDCGLKWKESLVRYNLNLCLSKIPQIYELKDFTESYKDCPAWGMMQDGAFLDVAHLAQITSETGCSFLPTPTSHNAKEGAYPAEYTRKTPTLSAQIGGKINPTWNEWRMGWPLDWTQIGESDSKQSAMVRFRQWLHLHGKL